MVEHLTKDQELNLGGLIQNATKAKEVLELNKNSAIFEFNDETIAKTQLLKIIRDGKIAEESLLESNTGLVWSRARAFKSKYPSAPALEDLFQEGYIGLMKAAKKYDPSMGNKFSTVAYYWIEQAIGRSVNKTGRLVRLPENRVQDYMNISKVRTRLEDSGLTPDQIDAQARKELNLTLAEFMDITYAAASPASLNKSVSSDDGDSKDLMDYISAHYASASSEDKVVKRQIYNILDEKLNAMEPIQRDIIASSFLVDGLSHKRLTTKEIREKYSLTPQKFKRILNESLNKLKKELDDLQISFEDFLG